jgi:hypothetical protein
MEGACVLGVVLGLASLPENTGLRLSPEALSAHLQIEDAFCVIAWLRIKEGRWPVLGCGWHHCLSPLSVP